MTVVALTHGYIRTHAMGGEVALHRALQAVHGERHVLTNTDTTYTVDGIRVNQIDTPDVLNIQADPEPIAAQLRALGATVVIGQNELSLPAVRAAKLVGAVSVVNVHTPPRYGATTREAIGQADHVVFNTATSAREWGHPESFVLHPPVGSLPRTPVKGPRDAYTLLSSLRNKGVTVVLRMAAHMPDQRFIIVRSPAEPTHGIPDLEERAAALPNVELSPRVAPDKVASTYLSQTRILLVPSINETYGMSAIEAAGHGIPSVSIMNDHVMEGIGPAAYPALPRDLESTMNGVRVVESEYTYWSKVARVRAEFVQERQSRELTAFAEHINAMEKR